ncbi:hypothetical protein AMELA_G00229090 [Ameiurus melas]|uniref:Secreted protein n=1 Tax=Ameiurus melas TaxID=219545 RepID=A0A7J5ZWE9_AMEME|nr:hypothetical protein AMELA_G00229090 [Ameiurus melas]
MEVGAGKMKAPRLVQCFVLAVAVIRTSRAQPVTGRSNRSLIAVVSLNLKEHEAPGGKGGDEAVNNNGGRERERERSSGSTVVNRIRKRHTPINLQGRLRCRRSGKHNYHLSSTICLLRNPLHLIKLDSLL